MPARSRKCHVSRLRLRGRRLTDTSGAGLPSLRLAAVFQPAFPAPPVRLPRLSSQARRGPGWAGENAAPGLGLAALPSLLPAFSPKSLALSLRFQQSSFSFSLGLDPDQPQTDNHRRHVAPGHTGLRRRPNWPPGPEWGRLGLRVSLHQR